MSHLFSTYRKGGRLYIAGNGGSAADSQHLATELVCRFASDRQPIPAEALTTDTSLLTAIANDYGFDEIFARQIEAKATSKDFFLAISTSGNSANIYKAILKCKSLDISCALLTGPSPGKCIGLPNYVLRVPGKDTATIQELHIVIFHSLCECLEHFIVSK